MKSVCAESHPRDITVDTPDEAVLLAGQQGKASFHLAAAALSPHLHRCSACPRPPHFVAVPTILHPLKWHNFNLR